MEQRRKFVTLAERGQQTFKDLCAEFGVSRKTGYKWLKRYRECGRLDGLEELSRRPLNSPLRTPEAIEKLILRERRAHPTWGPKKLRERLQSTHGIESPPAASVIGAILSRHGLSARRRRRRRPGVHRVEVGQLTEAERPNDVWAVDFKGWFTTADGQRCDPLTVSDLFSRYVLRCQALPGQSQRIVQPAFRDLFRYHGLPKIIRVDNGTPFASMGIGGLSRLSVWWTLQGITVEFTRPGHPQDNGSHERMHRTLKAEATRPPSKNLWAQQRRFERWRKRFNEERPHEAIGMARPAQKYQPSPRRLNERDNHIVYPEDYRTKTVSASGFFAWEGLSVYLGEALAGVEVGVRYNGRENEVYFANMKLGIIDASSYGRLRPTASAVHSSKRTTKP